MATELLHGVYDLAHVAQSDQGKDGVLELIDINVQG